MENLVKGGISESVKNLNQVEEIHHKMDELIHLIAQTSLDEATKATLDARFQSVIASRSTALQKHSSPIIDRKENNEFGQLLFMDNLDRRTQKKHTFYKVASVLVRGIIACLLILLGFGMIIMPAPPYFEMFTLFYINPNDGVTIMDVVSLLVVFTGVYLLISIVLKSKKH